jgi:Na+-transporting NADH:ubiquinone oxidoreductase subunit NqrB
MNDIWQVLGNGLGQITGVVLLVACAVLWLRRRTPWLLLALIGQIIAMMCRLLFSLSPSVLTEMPVFRIIWPLGSCLFALGLLAHAWFENTATSAVDGQEPRS